MKLQIHIITKFCLISFIAFSVFVSCKPNQKEEFIINQYQNYDMKKNEKLNTFNIYETVYEFYQTGDVSIFEKYLGYNVEMKNMDMEEIDSSLFPVSGFEDIFIRKNLFQKEKLILQKNLIVPLYINHPSKGRLVLLVYNYFKESKKTFLKREFVCRIFKDYAYLSCPEGCYLQEDNPVLDKKNHNYEKNKDEEPALDKKFSNYSYEKDNRKLAFFAENITKTRQYYTKLKPLYIVYEENDKLIVEEPNNDKYFMWLEDLLD